MPHHLRLVRPRTRADCERGPRPCPRVGCRHHLGLEVGRGGGVRLVLDPERLDEATATCSLDLADRGGATLQEVGEALNLTRGRVRQIEERALAKLSKRAGALAALRET